FQAYPEDEQAADRAHLPQLRIREEAAEERGARGEPALVHEDHDDGEEHAPAERRGERDRRETVEHALDREQAGVAGQAVLDRAEERERSDAEHDRRRHERLGHGAAAAAEAPLQRIAEGDEPLVETEQRTDDPADEDRAAETEAPRGMDRRLP